MTSSGSLTLSDAFIFHLNRAPRKPHKTVPSKHAGETIGSGELCGPSPPRCTMSLARRYITKILGAHGPIFPLSAGLAEVDIARATKHLFKI